MEPAPLYAYAPIPKCHWSYYMETVTTRYLDAVRQRLNLPSDNQLALHWKISPQRVYQYRAGRSEFSDDRAIEVAEILGIPPEKVLFEIQAERARKTGNTRVSAILEDVLQRLVGIAAALCIAVLSGLSFAPSDAVASTPQFRAALPHSAPASGSELALCKVVIQRFQAFRGWVRSLFLVMFNVGFC